MAADRVREGRERLLVELPPRLLGIGDDLVRRDPDRTCRRGEMRAYLRIREQRLQPLPQRLSHHVPSSTPGHTFFLMAVPVRPPRRGAPPPPERRALGRARGRRPPPGRLD